VNSSENQVFPLLFIFLNELLFVASVLDFFDRFLFVVADKPVAQVFALIVFFCDGYFAKSPLQVDNTVVEAEKVLRSHRFFDIAHRLPLELQMVLSNRLFWKSGDLIPHKCREEAFQAVLRSHYLGEVLGNI